MAATGVCLSSALSWASGQDTRGGGGGGEGGERRAKKCSMTLVIQHLSSSPLPRAQLGSPLLHPWLQHPVLSPLSPPVHVAFPHPLSLLCFWGVLRVVPYGTLVLLVGCPNGCWEEGWMNPQSGWHGWKWAVMLSDGGHAVPGTGSPNRGHPGMKESPRHVAVSLLRMLSWPRCHMAGRGGAGGEAVWDLLGCPKWPHLEGRLGGVGGRLCCTAAPHSLCHEVVMWGPHRGLGGMEVLSFS